MEEGVAARRPVSGPAAAPLAGAPCCSWSLACFEPAGSSGWARRCSGFLRELELGRLFWSPPAARAGLGAWVLSPKASLLVGGALCLTYGCVKTAAAPSLLLVPY